MPRLICAFGRNSNDTSKEKEPMKVRLSEILDTFDEMSETTSHYLDLETGEIVCIDRMLMEPSEIQELYEQLKDLMKG